MGDKVVVGFYAQTKPETEREKLMRSFSDIYRDHCNFGALFLQKQANCCVAVPSLPLHNINMFSECVSDLY